MRETLYISFKTCSKNKNEDEYRYAARVQDAVTLKYNNNF